MSHKNAILALADGTVFRGQGFGAEGFRVGEVVFNTAMSGYQEILTDPSYAGQIVVLTYPHIGNVGCNAEDAESNALHLAGLVTRLAPRKPSNWRSEQSLDAYMHENQRPGICDIDTRRLTRILRDQGAQNACIMVGEELDEAQAIAKARSFSGLQGANLASVVSCEQKYSWTEGVWRQASNPARYKVVVYDFGVKRNILRELVHLGCELTVVPVSTPVDEVLAMKPDGVMLSNGPGDPEPVSNGIAAAKRLMQEKVPLFGICLGHQILALASGAQTLKMKFGHHGANHPVQDLQTGQVWISSQNHGFAVDEASLPEYITATHRSLFDQSLQGIERTDCPAFSFQGHPEASPGPHDVSPLFQRFIDLMNASA
ncbi:MAG: glutamine-hydrolyzing carbamoyl-phosphate synthase small subunit [Oceanococcus sp.]